MKVYFDSSAMVAVYVNEAYSSHARGEVRKHVPVPWTPLHDLEVRNTFRLLRGRGQIDIDEVQGLLSHLDDDLRKGRLKRPAMELESFRRFLSNERRAQRNSD